MQLFLRSLLLCASVSLWWILLLPAFGQSQSHKHETILHRSAPANSTATQPPKMTDAAPDAGDINGDVYTNQFFGFSYTLPPLLTTVTDIMQGQEDLDERAFVLLSLESDASPGERPAALVIAADKVASSKPGVPHPFAEGEGWESAAAYLKRVAEIAAKNGGEPVGSTREYTFGGRKFLRADFRHAEPEPGFQTTVAGVRRGYVLVFNFAAEKQEQIEMLVQSLATLQFSK